MRRRRIFDAIYLAVAAGIGSAVAVAVKPYLEAGDWLTFGAALLFGALVFAPAYMVVSAPIMAIEGWLIRREWERRLRDEFSRG